MSNPILNPEYIEGDLIRVTAKFKVGTVLTDPTTVKVKVKNPAGTITTKTYLTDAEVVKDSAGIYHYDITLNASGSWWYRWESTGAAAGAREYRVQVRPSEFV